MVLLAESGGEGSERGTESNLCSAAGAGTVATVAGVAASLDCGSGVITAAWLGAGALTKQQSLRGAGTSRTDSLGLQQACMDEDETVPAKHNVVGASSDNATAAASNTRIETTRLMYSTSIPALYIRSVIFITPAWLSVSRDR